MLEDKKIKTLCTWDFPYDVFFATLNSFVPNFVRRLGLNEMSEKCVHGVAEAVRFTLEQKNAV